MSEWTAEGRLIVRLFPDYAGTVLWLTDPVHYEEAHLSNQLENDLRAWDRFCRSRLDPDLSEHAPSDVHEFAITGIALARRLADELGLGVEIHLIHEGRQVFRSSNPPTNSRAAQTLHTRAEQRAAEARAVIERLGGRGWYAYAPLSGSRFEPSHEQTDVDDPSSRDG
jgi:hypothetical protein